MSTVKQRPANILSLVKRAEDLLSEGEVDKACELHDIAYTRLQGRLRIVQKIQAEEIDMLRQIRKLRNTLIFDYGMPEEIITERF